MGATIAPVVGSGSCPTCMASVANPMWALRVRISVRAADDSAAIAPPRISIAENFAAGIKVLKRSQRTGQLRRCTVASEGTSGQQTSQFTAQESVSIPRMSLGHSLGFTAHRNDGG